MRSKISYGIIVLFAFIMGGLAMYYFSLQNRVVVTEEGEKVPQVTQTCKSCNSTVIMENGSLSASVEKVKDSVVMIKTFNGTRSKGSGSGFVYKIVGNDAYVITNHHVIDGGKITKKDYLITPETLPASKTIGLGDTVFTIGAPVGYAYRGTVTNGIVSGLNRLVEVSVKNSMQEDYVMEVIQTNTAVNPGNSGGPLFNTNGELVGVISMKLVENSIEGMGFAIPIDYVLSHISTLEKGGKIERPVLGISMANVNETYTLYKNNITVPNDVTEGVAITYVYDNSGAQKAGLQKGDVITKINSATVKNAAYLKYLLFKYSPGDTVSVTYNREGKTGTVKVTLTKNEDL